MTGKELVKKLAEHLGVASVYLGAPTFAYRVGDYTVDRQGRILDGLGKVVEFEGLVGGPRLKVDREEEEELETAREQDGPINLEVALPATRDKVYEI